MELERLINLALAQQWRDGADEALWICNHLDRDSASLKESEVRSILEFAGLPQAEVNKEIDLAGDAVAIGDLVYREWGVIVEYEGEQHRENRAQFTADLDRYALYRKHGHRYVQVTQEHLRSPRSIPRKVHRELVAGGYDGPAPTFGDSWDVLFSRIRHILGPRRIPGDSA
jgi:hypothetical protein